MIHAKECNVNGRINEWTSNQTKHRAYDIKTAYLRVWIQVLTICI